MATNRWMMACGLLMLLLPPSGVYADAPPIPDVAAPYADTRQDTLLDIEVRDGGAGVTRMTASVGDRGVGLVRVCGQACSWVGRLDLRGIAKGPQTLLVKAEDASGGTSEAAQPFFLVPQPYVLVSPTPGTSITGETVQAQVTPYSYNLEPSDLAIEGELLTPEGESLAAFSGQGGIDKSIGLPPSAGAELHYRVNVYDPARNVLSEQLHRLYREPAGALEEKGRVPGEIVDYDESRILYRTEAGDLLLRQEGVGPDAVVFPARLGSPGFAALTPQGAAVLASGFESGSFYTWSEGKLSLVREGTGERGEARGGYVFYDRGTGCTARYSIPRPVWPAPSTAQSTGKLRSRKTADCCTSRRVQSRACGRTAPCSRSQMASARRPGWRRTGRRCSSPQTDGFCRLPAEPSAS
ncbi:hypothetical protein PM3016_4920 [Paenibacillus mucilaginosus 3016]|uniref:Uncharacterized protein n=1 Tax=Paenibacillus mucilaginosus 3016 TaxID=1116391 RepID=H6NLT7_9BACL|nr:hypothetical protein [Paenibacillus mucilaginosus]AFC31652.1 hypothetical protein PM3016_4920 [Paenibacillus mucilaginosus 3016]